MLQYYSNDKNVVEIGIDEAGRGPLLGPVFAAAVILDPNTPIHPWLDDSKNVSKLRRKILRKWIEDTSLVYHVSYVSNDIIDQINIRKATYLAMGMAINGLILKSNILGEKDIMGKKDILLVVDGNYFPGLKNCFLSNDETLKHYLDAGDKSAATLISNDLMEKIKHVCVIRADALYANVAAASILAKEYHDEYIHNLLIEDPSLQNKYGLETNVGYGTAKHITGLKTFGMTKYHRQTFLTKIM